jgi:DNA-binding NarL/FixJ family response regulator
MKATIRDNTTGELRGQPSDGDVRTLIVDDQEAFRQALRQLIAATPGFTLVGEAASGEEAIDAVEAVSPQLVLMDVRMPGLGGVGAARAIRSRHPDLMVVLISVHDDEELPPELLSAGDAAGFVHKPKLKPRLLRELWERNRVPAN